MTLFRIRATFLTNLCRKITPLRTAATFSLALRPPYVRLRYAHSSSSLLLQSAPYASASTRPPRAPQRTLNAFFSTPMRSYCALHPARFLAQSPSPPHQCSLTAHLNQHAFPRNHLLLHPSVLHTSVLLLRTSTCALSRALTPASSRTSSSDPSSPSVESTYTAPIQRRSRRSVLHSPPQRGHLRSPNLHPNLRLE